MSDDDSDIEVFAVIPPKDASGNSSTAISHPNPLVKRRKSSPQMDPIPTYTPTPIHILERRRSATKSPSRNPYKRVVYEPTPISILARTRASTTPTEEEEEEEEEDSSSQSPSSPTANRNEDLLPETPPSPAIVGRTTVRLNSAPATRQSCRRIPPRSANACRPVSKELAKAVSSRRNSQQQAEEPQPQLSQASSASLSPKSRRAQVDEPVMWTPRLASGKPPSDLYDKPEAYTSPRQVKQRIAHKPTVPKNNQNRPTKPAGISKKVPSNIRINYLNRIIDEYLKHAYSEQESYDEALNEEQTIATQAANKNIYLNKVAGLMKRIREKAGVKPAAAMEDDPKYVNGNKVVSHEEILTGKVRGTISIEKKQKTVDPYLLNEYELYDRLLRYVVPVEELEAYGYPCRDPDDYNLRKAPVNKDGQKQKLRAEFAPSYACYRCSKVFRVDERGFPQETTGKCIYHSGHLWNERISRTWEKRYSCCKGDSTAGGCSSNPYHVHKGELELENYRGYVETFDKPELEPNRHGIYALDCEMCHTIYGLELTRVTVINHKSEVVYEKLVKPSNPILDYNTKFSGIKAGDLDEVSTTLVDVQRDLLKLFSSKTMLVGHSLDSDMRALKIFHKRFIDTAQLFPHKRGLPYKRALRTLMLENLRVIIQEDAGHDSKEDAMAAFKLVMWKAKTDVPLRAN